MVFSSHFFLFYFLPLALLLYYVAPRGWRMFVLTACSYLFYSWTNPWFAVLIAWATLVDFACGNFISGHWRLPGVGPNESLPNGYVRAPRVQRRLFVTLSLISNLGMLGFFKYIMFAEDNLNALLAAVGQDQFEILIVLLPAGISFYTFESISYNLDICFGKARPASVWIYESARAAGHSTSGFLRRCWLELRALNAFACYITQFPHLVAGPIIRYQDRVAWIHLAEINTPPGKSLYDVQLALEREVKERRYREEQLKYLEKLLNQGSYSDIKLMTDKLLAIATDRFLVSTRP